MTDNLRTVSNIDDFEKFLRKLCAFKSGWPEILHLLENANFLQGELRKRNLEWIPEDLEKIRNTKSGEYLLAFINDGIDAAGDPNAQLDFVRRHLADFAIYGFKLQLSGKIDF